MKHTECKDCELRSGDCGYHFKMGGVTNYDIASLSACDRYGDCIFFKSKVSPKGDIISRSALKEAIQTKGEVNEETWEQLYDSVMEEIDNAPTVTPEEFRPLIDKVVDILPELTNAIIEQLPQIINSNIKCSECSYYTDTWNVIPKPQGEWIFHKDYNERKYGCNKCGNLNNIPSNFCPNCGVDMRGKE